MSVRLAARGVPGFMHGGLRVGKGWLAVTALNDEQRATLRDFHGRFIQVHPDDRKALESEHGLKFTGPATQLEDLKTPKTKKSDKKE